MDGVLVVDKPAGPTSHDVVARVRRALKEKQIGHTGTLDPSATGVLPLVVGRATRLARFLSAGDKRYEARIRLGWTTDTGDAQGVRVGDAHHGPLPSREAIAAALDTFRGTFHQQPPAFSAKRIDGRRSYKIARADARLKASRSKAGLEEREGFRPAEPEREAFSRAEPGREGFSPVEPEREGFSPVEPEREGFSRAPAAVAVSVSALSLLSLEDDVVTVDVTCSAGFYVRALARDLGERLGIGGHLAALRRTRSGLYALSDAVPLDLVEHDPERAATAFVPLEQLLPELAAVVLTAEGRVRARHGRELRPTDVGRPVFSDAGGGVSVSAPEAWIRLLDSAGQLVGVAKTTASGLLHPSVVLV